MDRRRKQITAMIDLIMDWLGFFCFFLDWSSDDMKRKIFHEGIKFIRYAFSFNPAGADTCYDIVTVW